MGEQRWMASRCWCTVEAMVDFDTLIASLETRGYQVERVIHTPANAGDAELVIDGKLVSLEDARQLLEDSQPQ